MNAEHPPQPSPDTSTSSTTSRSLTASNPAPTTANRQFCADPAEERPRTSPAEAPRFRRSTNHTGPQTGRRPRRAKRELDPSDDHRQTFDQREEFDHAGHVEESPALRSSTEPDGIEEPDDFHNRPPLETGIMPPLTVRVRSARAGRPKKSGMMLSDSRF